MRSSDVDWPLLVLLGGVAPRSCADFMGCSAFSEYTVVNEINCAKVSKDAPLEKGAGAWMRGQPHLV